MRFWSWHRSPSDCWQRRLAVTVALAGYLVTVIGIPLPAYVDKQGSMPFPCQHHACGCATARQCWESCCCYTPRQKLAWAYANHVAPPARLVAEVAATYGHDAAHCAAPASKLTARCCAQRKGCSAAGADHDRHDDHDHVNCHDANCHEHDAQSAGITLVIGSLARQCRGMADLWCASGAALPPPAAVDWQFQWNLVARVALETYPLPASDLSPPVPPPRV